MTFLSAQIPFLFEAIGAIMMLVSMSAVTITGYHYLRAMEASQMRIQAEEEARYPQPRR